MQLSKLKNKIWLFVVVTIMTVGVVLFAINKNNEEIIETSKEYNDIKTYIVHKSTKRIHIDDCESRQRMSEKNEMIVTDSLSNLMKNGYIVCGNCNAGIKKKNLFTEIINNINPDIKYYEVGKLLNKNDYIDSIDDMGNWYVDHIATYQSILESDKKQDLNNESIYIKKYNLVDKNTNKEEGGKEFNVISELIDEKSIECRNGNIEILRASEKAVKYYQKNFYKIKFKERLASYPCDLIKNSTGSYNMAGDDCVRFLFSIMNNVNKKFVYDLEKISKYKWSHINARRVCKEDKIMDALYLLGFDVYDSVNKKRDYDYDGMDDYEIKQITNDFVFQKGDILVSNEHIHVYMGNGEKLAENFGWGKVNRKYPNKYTFNIMHDNKIGYYITIDTGKGNSDIIKYTRIYRYRDKEE